jgi:S1-C subfamily serine protease
MRSKRSSFVVLTGALLLVALSGSGCVSLQVEGGGFDIHAPIVVYPGASEVRGGKLDGVVVRARATVTKTPLHTRLVREVAMKTKSAVLSIYTKTQTPVRVRLFPLTPSFRVRLPGQALGSGFLIHPSGYALTNNHVVQDATDVRAITRDGQDLAVRVLARDPAYDLALIKIEGGSKLSVLPMGDSQEVGVGDMVIAIGNPLGLGHTVTAGIISQTHRNLSGVDEQEGRVIQFIQTDTAINPGSSGGPLITLDGAWVGVNTAGIVQAQNIGFSVPSSQVTEFLNEILSSRLTSGAAR